MRQGEILETSKGFIAEEAMSKSALSDGGKFQSS